MYRGSEELHAVDLPWAVNAVTFHPTSPVLVFAAGQYDGGYRHHGRLSWLDLTTGDVHTVLDENVRRLAWVDRTLVADAAPPFELDGAEAATRYTIDWEGMPDVRTHVLIPIPPHPDDDPGTPGRGAIHAVRALSDGRVLVAGADGLACLDQPGPLWTVEGAAHQIVVDGDGLIVNQSADGVVLRVSLDGVVSSRRTFDHPIVLTSTMTGRVLVHSHAHPVGQLLDGGTVDLGRTDAVNGLFDIARAPDLLVVKDRWVVGVSSGPLFPLEWDEERDARLSGGVGAYLPDRPSLVHTGQVHRACGTVGGFVVRRSYPDGAAEWVTTTATRALASDADAEFTWVATIGRDLTVLSSGTGAEIARLPLADHGIPLAVGLAGRGKVVVGTDLGRLLYCSLD
ncbi:hypothetical protein GCM10022243_16390 [Saccharothrix violaceirubra]